MGNNYYFWIFSIKIMLIFWKKSFSLCTKPINAQRNAVLVTTSHYVVVFKGCSPGSTSVLGEDTKSKSRFVRVQLHEESYLSSSWTSWFIHGNLHVLDAVRLYSELRISAPGLWALSPLEEMVSTADFLSVGDHIPS